MQHTPSLKEQGTNVTHNDMKKQSQASFNYSALSFQEKRLRLSTLKRKPVEPLPEDCRTTKRLDPGPYSVVFQNYKSESEEGVKINAQSKVQEGEGSLERKSHEIIQANTIFKSGFVPPRSGQRCRYFPHCRKKEACPFVHPMIICKNLSKCKFGQRCIFTHPHCPFGELCSVMTCLYIHTPKIEVVDYSKLRIATLGRRVAYMQHLRGKQVRRDKIEKQQALQDYYDSKTKLQTIFK